MLSHWTTLRLGGPAQRFHSAATTAELVDSVAAADSRGEPVLLLGGGSNLVVGDSGFPGTVVHVATRGVEIRDTAGDRVDVTVQAGENWEQIVRLVVDRGWAGMEALAGIPGRAGAAPIQNVGAYGQEIADTLIDVVAYDRTAREVLRLGAADCGFGYRTSRFKSSPHRFVIAEVTFRLRSDPLSDPVGYDQLAARLGISAGERVPIDAVYEAVLNLRRSKGMVLDASDHDTWSAGSFFTNPVIEPQRLPPGAPAFPQVDGRVKTSAAWLVEQAGFRRGYGSDRAGLSTKHTLAITNRGAARTQDVLDLAVEIQRGVIDRFGIRLEPEPVLVGCGLS